MSMVELQSESYWLPWRWSIHNLSPSEAEETEGLPLGNYIVRSCSIEGIGVVVAGYATVAITGGPVIFLALNTGDLTIGFEYHRDQMEVPFASTEGLTALNEFENSIDVCVSGIFVPQPLIIA